MSSSKYKNQKIYQASGSSGERELKYTSPIRTPVKVKSPSKAPIYNADIPTYKAEVGSPKIFPKIKVESPRVPKSTNQYYSLMLRIFYETIPGESICVVGSIPELGLWKELKAHMTWTEGHIWVLDAPIVTNEPYFSYKYVLMDNDKEDMVKWESGIDRIADLRLLKEVEAPVVQAGTGSSEISYKKKVLKHVELFDEWETFIFRFSIFYPLSQYEEMAFTSSRTGEDPIKMELTKTTESWKYSKYGQNMRPYECIIKMPNNVSGDEGQFDKLNQED